ncbi:hypothetical protein SASPL_156280 [Salvia splendens]|uniref:Uncharacterized protein n=1 Tax=Salvia splendens TaxID=180675 RepID=A0A8X8VWZ4_SALSN|nr:hypothetical protein SASPL_156280 [Salvia splendens]
MTYNNADHGDLRMDVDYVKLAVGVGGGAQCLNEASPSCGGGGQWWSWLWWWAKLLLVALFIGILLAVFLKWIGPFVMEKVWLERYPKRASVIRLTGEGNVKFGPYFFGTLVWDGARNISNTYTLVLFPPSLSLLLPLFVILSPQILLNIAGFSITVAADSASNIVCEKATEGTADGRVLNIIISFTIMKCEKECAQYFYEIMAFHGLVYDEEDEETIGEQRSNIDSDDDCAESDTSVGYDVAIEESADDEKGDGDENVESRIEEFIAETIKRWRKELQLIRWRNVFCNQK